MTCQWEAGKTAQLLHTVHTHHVLITVPVIGQVLSFTVLRNNRFHGLLMKVIYRIHCNTNTYHVWNYMFNINTPSEQVSLC